MYEQHFGFKEKPFNMTPDPKYYFASAKHRSALDSLLYAVLERKGFVVVTGEIGAGKTTVCRTLLSKLGERTTWAMLNNTNLTPKQLISNILDEYEIEHTDDSKHAMLSKLNHFLVDQLAHDHNVILIIDEAQNLSTACLEEVRMLSNLETEKEKLIQLILMGQPELRDTLNLPSMVQFKQRVAIHYHLYPLNQDETIHYIQHRVMIARNGHGNEGEVFTLDAMKKIHTFSGGVPRIINNVCDNALLTAYANGAKTIDLRIACEVTGEIFESHENISQEQDDVVSDTGVRHQGQTPVSDTREMHIDHHMVEMLEKHELKPQGAEVSEGTQNTVPPFKGGTGGFEDSEQGTQNPSALRATPLERGDGERPRTTPLTEGGRSGTEIADHDRFNDDPDDFIDEIYQLEGRRRSVTDVFIKRSKYMDALSTILLSILLIAVIIFYATIHLDTNAVRGTVKDIVEAIMHKSREVFNIVADDNYVIEEKIARAMEEAKLKELQGAGSDREVKVIKIEKNGTTDTDAVYVVN